MEAFKKAKVWRQLKKMTQQLTTFTAFTEDLTQAPSTHTRLLTISCNSAAGVPTLFWLLELPTYMRYTYPQRDTQIHINKNDKYEKNLKF